MKKKLAYGLLMAALSLGFTSSMISCKDYDDEKIGSLQSIVASNDATLRQLLAAQKSELEGQITALNTLLQQCQQNCQQKQQELNEKFNNYVTILSYNQFKDEVGNNYYTKSYIDGNFYTQAQINQMFSSLDYYTQQQVNDMLDAIKAEMAQLASEQTIVNLLENSESILYQTFQQIINQSVEQRFTTINNNITNINDSITNITNNVNNLSQLVVNVNARLDEAMQLAQQAYNLAKSNQTAIGELDTKLTTQIGQVAENLSNAVADLTTKINNAQTTADEALAMAKKNSGLIANHDAIINILQTNVGGLQEDIRSINLQLTAVGTDIDALRNKIFEDSVKAANAHNEMLVTIMGLADSIKSNAQTIGELRSDFTTFQVEINARLDLIQAAIDAAKNAATSNDTQLQKLFGTFENVMAKFITGIVINETYNPLFGSFNLPVDVRSNVLVAFHGNFGTNGLQFPTDDETFYALPASYQWENITEKDIEMMFGPGGSLEDAEGYIDVAYDKEIVAQDGAEGNAGVLYVTVNPTDRDFTGTQFQLINSRNEVSAMQLSDLQPSNHLIQFGTTRAAVNGQSANGFYESKATLQVADLDKVKMDLELSSLKDLVSEFKNFGRTGDLDFTKVSTTIYQNFNNVLPAQALKATWTDSLGQKSVVSQYALAATTIKPLSFAFAKDIDFDSIAASGFGRVEDFLDGIVDRVMKAFPEVIPEQIDIEEIVLDELTDDLTATFHLRLGTRFIRSAGPKTVTINVPSITLTGTKGEKYVISASKPTVTVTITGNDSEIVVNYNIESVVNAMGKYCSEPVANIKKQLQDFLDDVNKYIRNIKKISVNNIKSEIKQHIADFISEYCKKFQKWFNPTKLLQPALLVKSGTSYASISEVRNVPSKVGGTKMLLVPTTYNAETIAPAYKKFIAFTNVRKDGKSAQDGDADCKNVLDQANSQDRFKCVIDGGHSEFIDFTAQLGYTYEILYTAVDYTGQVVTKKFYITVEE